MSIEALEVLRQELGMPEVFERPREAMVKSSRVAKWGNGLAVRLTAEMLQRANLHLDDSVQVIARDDEIVIRRQRSRITLDQRLATFDPLKHRHAPAFDDVPRGGETALEVVSDEVSVA